MMSMSGKMAIKISCDNITKRVRELPENFEALRTTIKAQMSKGTGSVAKSVKADRFAVTYEDDTGDTINLSDDEDLLAAYDVAENHILNKQLKLKIVPREGEEETQPEVKIQEEIRSPLMKMSIQDSFPKKAFKDEMQIDSTTVQNAIKETMNGGKTEDESSEDSDSEVDQKRKKPKKMFGNMPKKAFRKMIKKEMGKQFSDMMEQKASVSAPKSVSKPKEPEPMQIDSSGP